MNILAFSLQQHVLCYLGAQVLRLSSWSTNILSMLAGLYLPDNVRSPPHYGNPLLWETAVCSNWCFPQGEVQDQIEFSSGKV